MMDIIATSISDHNDIPLISSDIGWELPLVLLTVQVKDPL